MNKTFALAVIKKSAHAVSAKDIVAGYGNYLLADVLATLTALAGAGLLKVKSNTASRPAVNQEYFTNPTQSVIVNTLIKDVTSASGVRTGGYTPAPATPVAVAAPAPALTAMEKGVLKLLRSQASGVSRKAIKAATESLIVKGYVKYDARDESAKKFSKRAFVKKAKRAAADSVR